MGNWWSAGMEGIQDEVQRDAERRSSFGGGGSGGGLRRFFMKAGETREIVFLDDTAFRIFEHQIFNGKYRNYFTCPMSECPLCAAKVLRSEHICFSVVDLTGFTKNNGEVVDKNIVKLLPAKKDVAAILDRKKSLVPGNSLVGCHFSVFRSSTTDKATGSNFDLIRKYDPAKLAERPHKPINYVEALKPLSIEKLREVAAGLAGQPNAGQWAAPVSTKQPLEENQEVPSDGIPY